MTVRRSFKTTVWAADKPHLVRGGRNRDDELYWKFSLNIYFHLPHMALNAANSSR